MKKKTIKKYEKCNWACNPDTSLYVLEQENIGGEPMFQVPHCTENKPRQDRNHWLFEDILSSAFVKENNLTI